MKFKENGQVIGELIEIEKRTKETHFKSSNKFTINFLISLGFAFEEEIYENKYQGKVTYTFEFPTNQDGINEAIDMVKKCRENNEHLPFPKHDTRKQLSFKSANKERWMAIEICFPELRRD